MLPIYQSLYPLYVTVATERLIYLKYILKDEANFKNEYLEVMRVLAILETWIYWAHDSVLGDLRTKVAVAECRNDNDMQPLVSEWMADFTETYITNLADNTAEIMQLDGTQIRLCQIRFKKTGNVLIDYYGTAYLMAPADANNDNSYWFQIQKPEGEMQLQNKGTNRYLFGTETKATPGDKGGYVETSERVTDTDNTGNSWWKLVQIPNSEYTALFSIGHNEYIYETSTKGSNYDKDYSQGRIGAT
eukprot:UN07387